MLVAPELGGDLLVYVGDDGRGGRDELVSALGGMDALRSMVGGIRDTLEVAAHLEVVDQRLDRLLAHSRVGRNVDRAPPLRTGPLQHCEIARPDIIEAGGDKLAVNAGSDRLPRGSQQDAQHRRRSFA